MQPADMERVGVDAHDRASLGRVSIIKILAHYSSGLIINQQV